MGTWGTGPFDNDGAADTVAQLMRACKLVLSSETHREAQRYYADARVGIQVRLLAHGTDILGGTSLDIALEALQCMRADHSWLQSWRKAGDRKALIAALDAEIRAVQRAMRKKIPSVRERIAAARRRTTKKRSHK